MNTTNKDTDRLGIYIAVNKSCQKLVVAVVFMLFYCTTFIDFSKDYFVIAKNSKKRTCIEE